MDSSDKNGPLAGGGGAVLHRRNRNQKIPERLLRDFFI
jgi:hypothetical protein